MVLLRSRQLKGVPSVIISVASPYPIVHFIPVSVRVSKPLSRTRSVIRVVGSSTNRAGLHSIVRKVPPQTGFHGTKKRGDCFFNVGIGTVSGTVVPVRDEAVRIVDSISLVLRGLPELQVVEEGILVVVGEVEVGKGISPVTMPEDETCRVVSDMPLVVRG